MQNASTLFLHFWRCKFYKFVVDNTATLTFFGRPPFLPFSRDDAAFAEDFWDPKCAITAAIIFLFMHAFYQAARFLRTFSRRKFRRTHRVLSAAYAGCPAAIELTTDIASNTSFLASLTALPDLTYSDASAFRDSDRIISNQWYAARKPPVANDIACVLSIRTPANSISFFILGA